MLIHLFSIVAISGLGGHAFGSFKERDGEHMWLRDALPWDITGEGADTHIARIMLYGYSSSLSQHDNFQSVEDLATSFHTSLRSLVVQGTSRPIVFIAHSLGGLIIKQVRQLTTSVHAIFSHLTDPHIALQVERRRGPEAVTSRVRNRLLRRPTWRHGY